MPHFVHSKWRMDRLVLLLRIVCSRYLFLLIGSFRYYIRSRNEDVIFWCARTLGAIWHLTFEDGPQSLWNPFSVWFNVEGQVSNHCLFGTFFHARVAVRLLSDALILTQVWQQWDIFYAFQADDWPLMIFLDALVLPRIFLCLFISFFNYLVKVENFSTKIPFHHLSLFRSNFKIIGTLYMILL